VENRKRNQADAEEVLSQKLCGFSKKEQQRPHDFMQNTTGEKELEHLAPAQQIIKIKKMNTTTYSSLLTPGAERL